MAQSSSLAFDRIALLAALDEIGTAAASHGTRLDLAIYGGSALMLASNFRFSTEDVDIAELGEWPAWLGETVAAIAARNGWVPDWLNEAVTFHLSPLAGAAADHMVYGSFPRGAAPGLVVSVPTTCWRSSSKPCARQIPPRAGSRQTISSS